MLKAREWKSTVFHKRFAIESGSGCSCNKHPTIAWFEASVSTIVGKRLSKLVNMSVRKNASLKLSNASCCSLSQEKGTFLVMFVSGRAIFD